MENLLNNPWAITIGGGIVVAIIGYYVFAIGKGGEKNKINKSSFISAGGNVTAGRDIVIGSRINNKKRKTKPSYIYKKRSLIVTDSEPKNLSLPIEVTSFKRISSKISLINAENIKWRVGYRFIKRFDSKKAYVFHVYQDPGSHSFHSRIVEIEADGQELSRDIRENQIAVEDTKNFELVIENKNGEIFFYVDGILLGKYSVPLQEISDLYIRGWSHGNNIPITIIIESVRVWF